MRLTNAGQVCTAAKRFILHEKIAVNSSASSPGIQEGEGGGSDERYRTGAFVIERCSGYTDQTGREAVKNGATARWRQAAGKQGNSLSRHS